jgi:hypothetical protein
MPKIDLSNVEWYSRSRGPAMLGPSVAISKAGRVVLNQEALDLIGQPDALQVGIIQGSRGKLTLVLQASAKGDAGSLTLSKQGKSKYSLGTSKFLRDRGLDKHFGNAEGAPDLDEEANTLAVTF